MMPSFDWYSGTFDASCISASSKTKMAVYAHDDLLFCRVFPFSFKGAAYHWFYSLPKNFLQSFDDVTDTFYNQFAS